MVEQIQRGVALVEKVIAGLEAGSVRKPDPERPWEEYRKLPQPFAPEVAAALTTPDGRPIPESLRRFLTYDAAYLGADMLGKRLKWQSYAELVEAQFGREKPGRLMSAFALAFPAPCLLLPPGPDSCRFLYAGQADALGEFPIFVAEEDVEPFLGLSCAGFDHYIADLFEVIEAEWEEDAPYEAYFDDPRFAEAMEWHARANLNGFGSLSRDGHLDGEDVGSKLWDRHYSRIDKYLDAARRSKN